MLRYIRKHISLKLFFSYSLVVLVNGIILAGIASLAIPRFFSYHMQTMGMGGMMGKLSGSMMGDLLLNFRAIFFESLLVGLLIAFFIVVIVSALFSQRFVSPLRDMMVASQRIAQGKFDERVSLSSSSKKRVQDDLDELGQLAHSFNTMAEKLENIEEMRIKLIADISHELRTPLSVIKGSMEALEDGILQPEPATFQQIQREAARMERLVEDLQELSRVEAQAYDLHVSKMSLGTLIRQAVRVFEPDFRKKKIDSKIDIEENLPDVNVDEDRINQVLHNLIGNALQYTPENGIIKITAQHRHAALIVSVEDNGIGISGEHIPFLFTRFYRVDKSRSRAHGGSGIGLTIAHHLIEAHGGRIWVESDGEGKGSTFSFSLPV